MNVEIKDNRKLIPNKAFEYKRGDIYRAKNLFGDKEEVIAIVDMESGNSFIIVISKDKIGSMGTEDFKEEYSLIENVTNLVDIKIEIR